MVRDNHRSYFSHGIWCWIYPSGGYDIHDHLPLPSSQSEEEQGTH
nr:hypothetical protein [Providencia sp. PROV020]